MKPLDRFLIERILIDGEKPSDVVNEAKILMEDDHLNSMSDKQVSGYLYTRYARAKQNCKNN